MDSLSSERHNDSIYLHVVVRQFIIGSFGKKPKKKDFSPGKWKLS